MLASLLDCQSSSLPLTHQIYRANASRERRLAGLSCAIATKRRRSTAREGMYAAVRSPTLLPHSHRSPWTVEGSQKQRASGRYPQNPFPLPSRRSPPFSLATPQTEKPTMLFARSFQFETQVDQSAKSDRICTALCPIRDLDRNVGGFQFAVASVSVSPPSGGSRGPRDGCSWPGNTRL